jgi:hypothetical protein
MTSRPRRSDCPCICHRLAISPARCRVPAGSGSEPVQGFNQNIGKTVRRHRTHTSSRFALALLAMLVLPLRKQIRSIGEAAHHPVDAGISDGLQNDTAKLVFQKLDLPAAIPCLRRSSAGTTSWPFEVNVARSSSMTYTLLQVRHRRGGVPFFCG